MSLKIIPFKPELSIYFRDLNLSWLEKYFYVEPKDAELLENCKSSIIDKGGYIFFAEMDLKIVGCYSMIKLQDSVYELGKMAVDETCQGKKIGQKLLAHGIAFAKSQNWKHLLLYSNTILKPAIYIYKKFGFREVVMEKDTPYARSNIKMQLDLF
ncbi:GNAT family N-acetyltransferase [uncultured Eudoraea sp.]|uniref:GNAT family N-acetyltransferase n=1 Tax=uncultured Eudoraea sp. TaxID=1035614 RepID=UPI0026296B24|nr:GNAT family N-acetyltransferase [uncultured Eudoraea sp.]